MPISTAGNSNKQSGFTLIELGIVVLLISLFTLISIPLFSNSGKADMQASARKLSGTIKYLFNEAALTGLEHRLIYNLDRGTYRAQTLEADGSLVDVSGIGQEAALKNGVRFDNLRLPGRGTFTTGEVTVRIHPTGWLEETIVHLTAGTDIDLTLSVNSLTGSSEIFTGRRELELN